MFYSGVFQMNISKPPCSFNLTEHQFLTYKTRSSLSVVRFTYFYPSICLGNCNISDKNLDVN